MTLLNSLSKAVALFCCVAMLSPSVAKAQTEVFGSGFARYFHGVADGLNYFEHVSVNASVDSDGVAHGWMTWEGALQYLPRNGKPAFPGGPSDPWFIAVTDILFIGNAAYVSGVVVNSPYKPDEGTLVGFSFTDNRGTGEPDMIDGQPIDAGNVTVK